MAAAGAASGAEASFHPDEQCSACPQLKHEYEMCFQDWYEGDFLRHRSIAMPCIDEFKRYQQCVLESMKAKNLLGLLDQKLFTEANPSANPSP